MQRQTKRDYEMKIWNEAKKNHKFFSSYSGSNRTVGNKVGLLLDNDDNLISENKEKA